ncbi:MAG: hypothetical protein Q8N77_06625 [Nanoarchaeota archaeon]|nr:hypothetical protein [Nanoarchaeota archaeon]
MPAFEIKNNEITIEKETTKLDEFVIKLLSVIERYTKYAIIGGYSSIFFGRSRATEDIDIFIEPVSYKKFQSLYEELTNAGYELTIDDPKSLYKDYLREGLSIRIWEKGFPLLNLEVKFAKKKTQKETLDNRITVNFNGGKIYFGKIEAQIAYKKYILKSQKDLEDARHLEIVFKNLSKEKIEYYKKVFEDEFKR